MMLYIREYFVLLLLTVTTVFAAEPPAPIAVAVPSHEGPVSYVGEIADILDAKCVGCHNGGLAESQLNLEEVAGMLKGGKHGPAIVAGKADESLLFKMAAHRVEPVMPPKDKKDQTPLTPEELGLIKLWIDSGAKDDSETADAEPKPKPIVLGALPPGVHPIVAVDMTGEGARVAAGRANVVEVYDIDSGLEILALGGHKDIIQSLRFSPDGKRLAAGSYQVVTVWNAPTGGLRATSTGHSGQVKAVVPLPENSGFVSGGLDRTVRVWDQAGKPVRQFDTPAPVLALSVAPDGKSLAVGGEDRTVRILDASDGKERLTLTGHTGPVVGVAFLGNGDRVASVSADGTGRLWTLPLPEEGGASPSDPIVFASDAGPLRALAASPDGTRVAIAGDRGEIRLRDAEGGKREEIIPALGAPVLALAFSPEGDRILAGHADRTARLLDATSRAVVATLAGHLGPVNAVAFSPDGRRMATAGEEGGVKVWETATVQGVIAFGHTAPKGKGAAIQPIQAIAFTSNASIVTASADATLKTWAFEGSWSEDKALGPHAFRVLSLDFNPDGTLLAAGGGEPSRSGEIKLWEVGKGMLVRSLDALHTDTVFGVRFSPDGGMLASGAADKFVKVTRISDGAELKTFEGHTHHVLAVDWKSDGKQIASGGADNVIKVWEFATGEQLKTLPPAGKQVTALRWAPGKPMIVGASGDRLVRAWDPEGGKDGKISRTFNGPSDFVFGVAVSNDGSRIAAGDAAGTLFVWDAQDGTVLRKIGPAE